MKIAIVHDELMRKGGAEHVVRAVHDIYPEAPIYTSVYYPDNTYPEYKGRKIHTSWFQYIARNEKLLKWLFFPFGLLAMRGIYLKGYDVVFISTTYSAKFIRVEKGTKIITYCYTPFRLVWSPESYKVYETSRGFIRWCFNLVISILKPLDKRAAGRSDYFIAMTEETKQRIIKAYQPQNDIAIVNPPVNLDNYTVSHVHGDYYLIVSRLEPYKKVDLVVEAFNQLGKRLIVVGKGSQEDVLHKIAKPNIEFKTNLTSEELSALYAGCKAFVFPQYEDYGITPLEANASGKPVIAFHLGGVNDTMISYEKDPEKATAIFFSEQTISSLIEAIHKFEKLKFDPLILRKNAERFSEEKFQQQIKELIERISNE